MSEAEFDEILTGNQKEYVCFITTFANVGREPSVRVEVEECIYEPSTRSIIYMDTKTVARVKMIKKEDIEQLKKAILH